MNSVTPMKLIPVSNNETNSNNSSKEFPTISTNEIVIKKQKNLGNLTNLDSELLEILHNNDLSDDAKAKLYWIALHKSEVYKDKSMWSEPTIVELRENRFIPISLSKPITPLVENGNINRKRKIDESDINKMSNKRKKLNNFPKDIDLNMQPSNIEPSRKRKILNDNEASERELKRMALVNRIENGQISQGEIDREEENIESNILNQNEPHIISEPDIISGPLVVVNQQDEAQPSTSSYTPSQFKISENLKDKLQPEWLKIFYSKMYSQDLTPFVQSQIKNIIEKIMDKDDKFKITGHAIITSESRSIKTDPISLFVSLIHAKSRTTRALDILKNYLNKLNIEYQEGAGFKNRILKWVKL